MFLYFDHQYMKQKTTYLLFFGIFLFTPILKAQILKNNKYTSEVSTFLSSTKRLPFLLRTNLYGEVPMESQFVQFAAEVQHEYDSVYTSKQELNKFSLGYGARAIANVGQVNQFRLTEAYIKARLNHFEIYVGRRREVVGLVDTLMTSGSYIWSGNALPLPKVQIGIPNYTPILGKGLLSIKGSFAHGWFGSTDSVQNYYLHQKTFYARIGRPSWKFKFYAGFNHQVQWGGRPTVPWYDTQTEQVITQYPSDLKAYINVVSGLSLNRKLDAGDIKDGVPYNEAFNRAGNHLGTIDIAMEFETNLGTIFLYRQSIYEDGSLFYLNNIKDGLTGFSIKPSYTSKEVFRIIAFNLEYLDTRNQGGNDPGGDFIPQLRGNDNYFNNGIYEDGYTFKGNTIGTPFIMPSTQFNTGISTSNLNPNYLVHNRVKALSLGILSSFGCLTLKLKHSYVVSEGSFGSGSMLENNSTLIEGGVQKNQWHYRFMASTDFGEFWTVPHLGIRLSAIRTFSL